MQPPARLSRLLCAISGHFHIKQPALKDGPNIPSCYHSHSLWCHWWRSLSQIHFSSFFHSSAEMTDRTRIQLPVATNETQGETSWFFSLLKVLFGVLTAPYRRTFKLCT